MPMVAPLSPHDPRQLGGFRLSGRLGEGGQGVVYLGQGPGGEQVAVKVLRIGSDPEARRRLDRELAASRTVASFCTARVLTASVDGPQPYVVSEFIDGPSLQERVAARGPLSGGDLDRLAVGTATALAAIHGAGVIHRDLKPSNVLLGPDGPRVVDFGIARPTEADTVTSGLIGTPAYLSPEQVSGRPATAASDVFAWGSLIVYAATGRPAFGGGNIAAVLMRIASGEPDLSGVPSPLRAVVARCLDKDPARRPSARDLLLQLVGSSGDATPRPGGPALAPHATAPPSPPPGADPAHATTHPGRTPGRRRPFSIAVAVAVAVVAATTAVVVALHLGNGGRPDGRVAVRASTTPASAASPASSPAGSAEPDDDASHPSSSPSGAASTPTSGPEPDGPAIPAAFAGTWAGHITPDTPLLSEYDLVIELPGGKPKGSWRTDECTGDLRLTKVASARLTLVLENVPGCVPGTVILTRKGDTLTYFWRDVPGNGLISESGMLARKT